MVGSGWGAREKERVKVKVERGEVEQGMGVLGTDWVMGLVEDRLRDWEALVLFVLEKVKAGTGWEWTECEMDLAMVGLHVRERNEI